MDDIWTNNLNDTIDSIKNNNNIYTQGNVNFFMRSSAVFIPSRIE